MSDEKIQQLTMIEQTMQQYLQQKQQIQAQLMEFESALEELGKTEKAYKIVGNIMVSTEKDVLKKDLEEKKNIFDVRLKALENQENKLKEKAKKLREEAMKEMK
jgi:prefoldin beta subunit